jgi:NADPH2:quinone reductase
MLALRCREYGPLDRLVVEEIADPEPGPNEVVVRVESASASFPDVLIAQDLYQISVPVPFTPVSFAGAAVFWVVYATAYHALRSVAEVSEGEWIVVLGAAGGVGLATVDLAQLLGAKVLAAASTDAKLAVCSDRGASAVVNYATEDLKMRIKELTGGAEVVIDPVGGPFAGQALRAMRWGAGTSCSDSPAARSRVSRSIWCC